MAESPLASPAVAALADLIAARFAVVVRELVLAHVPDIVVCVAQECAQLRVENEELRKSLGLVISCGSAAGRVGDSIGARVPCEREPRTQEAHRDVLSVEVTRTADSSGTEDFPVERDQGISLLVSGVEHASTGLCGLISCGLTSESATLARDSGNVPGASFAVAAWDLEPQPDHNRSGLETTVTRRSHMKLRPEWDEIVTDAELTTFADACRLKNLNSGILYHEAKGEDDDSEDDIVESARKASVRQRDRRWMIDPGSMRRLAWDVTGMTMLAYDSIFIPLSAFDISQTTFVVAMDWVALIYWTIDMPATFVTGYYTHGVLEIEAWKVMKRYVRSWFLFDIILTGIGWSEMTLGADATSKNLSLLRNLRVLRTLRLLRLLKLKSIIEKIADFISSEFAEIGGQVFCLTAFIVLLNHFIACLWWWMGNTPNTGPGWVQTHDMGHRSTRYNYATSFHWSLTQFTPASMEIFPTNEDERSMAVVTLLFALIVFSSFVSSITTSMTKMRQVGNEMNKSRAFTRLRLYFLYHNIPVKLSMRIRKYLRHMVAVEQKVMEEKDIELLNLLSESLRQELRLFIISPILTVHPFLKAYCETYPEAAQKLCTYAVTHKKVSKGDILFSAGETANETIFIVRGKLLYTDDAYDERTSRLLKQNEWVCESALWLNSWVHHGDLLAASNCDIFVLDAKKFASMTATFRPVLASSRTYALAYKNALEKAAKLNDLLIEEVDFEEMTYSSFPGSRPRSSYMGTRLAGHSLVRSSQ